MELAKGKEISGKAERKGGGKAAESAAKQFETLRKLARIKELLPKDGNGGGGQNQNQQNQNQQNENQQKENKNQDQDQNQDQEKNKDQKQEPQESQDEKKEQEEKQSDAGEQEKKDDGQVEDILRRAQERSDQHDADKKARMKKAPLPANERDW